jgi:hypothetical protein
MEAVKGLYGGSTEAGPDLTRFQARRAFDTLESWVLSEDALGLAEHEVEAQIERRGREVMRLTLQAHLNRRGTGRVGEAVVVQQAQGAALRQPERRVRSRTIRSIFGRVRVARTAYMEAGSASVNPLDEDLELPGRSHSYEVQRRVVCEAVRGPYEEAVGSLEAQTGGALPKRSAQEIVRDAAVDFDAFYEQRQAFPAGETGPIVVASVDGKGIPMVKPQKAEHRVRLKKGEKTNKKRMATVAAVYTQGRRVRTPQEVLESLFDGKRPEGKAPARAEHKRVWASLHKGKDEVIAQAGAEADRRDPERVKTRAAVTDGERALQQRVRKQMPGVLLILDLVHALERLWIGAHALYAEGSAESVAWVRSHALAMLEGDVSQVVKGMRQSATKRGLRGGRRRAILAASAYLYRNRRYMRYGEYLAAGLPIASGAVEGACKNLVKDRMERSGMRWTEEGAEAVLKLRALKLSGDLEEYWRFHIRQDQLRLYGSRPWKAVA